MKAKRIEENLYEFTIVIDGKETPISYNRIEDIESAKANLETEINKLHEKLVETNLKLELINAMPEYVDESEGVPDFNSEKRFEIKSDKDKFLKLIEEVPDFAVYRKAKNLVIHYFENYVIFYVDSFFQGHRELLESYLGIEAITDRQEPETTVQNE